MINNNLARQQARQKKAQLSSAQKIFGKKSMQAGEFVANKFYAPGSLGRIAESYSDPQYQAMREQMSKGIESNTQTSLASLAKAQSRGKVYGAAAGAQSANVLESAQRTKDDLEQQLMVKDVDFSRAGSQYNLAQQAAELAGRAGGWMGTINYAEAKKQAKKQAKMGQQAINKM